MKMRSSTSPPSSSSLLFSLGRRHYNNGGLQMVFVLANCLLLVLQVEAKAQQQLQQETKVSLASSSSISSEAAIEAAIFRAAAAAAAAGQPDQPKQEESYQRVYEAFTKLMENVSNNSLGNVRRLVSRLNQLVGTTSTSASTSTSEELGIQQVTQVKPQQQQLSGIESSIKREQQTSGSIQNDADKRTEQILNRLDGVNKNTDQNTLRQLNEDVSKLVGTLSESYLRNIRRVIERVNRVVGRPAVVLADQPASSSLLQKQQQQHQQQHQQPSASDAAFDATAAAAAAAPASSILPAASRQHNNNEDDPNRQPGFPGWDELIVAMDRVQKSLASFVRSSTKLITAGRR